MDTDALFELFTHLSAKYGLDGSGLEADGRAMADFCVTVPVIGPFNSGKSALLNALLDTSLLPCGITAETPVPTELSYGESYSLQAFRQDVVQRLDVGVLRTRSDWEGVEFLRLTAPLPFLHKVGRLRLVDMPGLDSGAPGREQAMRAYLPRSLAYVLVFSADEPVIKQSIFAFLSELRLQNMPLLVLLSKCDKHTPEACRVAQAYLETCFASQLHMSGVSVRCVHAGAAPRVQEAAAMLEELQRTAQALREREFARRLLSRAHTLQGYLSQRLADAALECSEIDGRAEQLERLQAASDAGFAKNAAYFESARAAGVSRALERASAGLSLAAKNIAELQSSGVDAVQYADGVLRGLVSAGAGSELDPVLAACADSMPRLLALQGSEAPESPAPPSCLKQALALFHGCGDLPEHQLAQPEGLAGLMRACLDTASLQCMKELQERWSVLLQESFAFRRHALEDVLAQKAQNDAARTQAHEELTQDLADVCAAQQRLTQIAEVASHVQ